MKYAVFVFSLLVSAPLLANPTGAPLLTWPVEPCRFLDTRVGAPLPAYNAMDAFVRGFDLRASDGAAQTDCKVPAGAEAVIVNLTVVSPAAAGYLKVNGTGFVSGPKGAYARLTFAAGQIISNEMTVSLCNIAPHPLPQAPCPFDDAGRYLDFQILNVSPGEVHVVGDVVGYLART